MKRTSEPRTALPPERAFVIQLRAGTDVEHGPLAGRVEHVVSGQAARFNSVEAMVAFFARCLGSRDGPPGET